MLWLNRKTKMKNILIIAILIGVTVLVVRYLINEKKNGAVCIGCPYAEKCSGHNCHSLEGSERKILIK